MFCCIGSTSICLWLVVRCCNQGDGKDDDDPAASVVNISVASALFESSGAWLELADKFLVSGCFFAIRRGIFIPEWVWILIENR